jgi:hypothetical protein
MTRSARKFVAMLMLLWLPLFTGSALAATVSMQLPHGSCHEAQGMQAMTHGDMHEHHPHHAEQTPTDEHTPSCATCGVCHLACTGYLAVPSAELAAIPAGAAEATPYLVVFHSVTYAPLVPPPLVSA